MEKIHSYISRLSSPDISVQESSLRLLINCSIDSHLLLTIYNEIKIKTFQSLLRSENEVIIMLTIWLMSHLCGSIYISSEVLKSQMILDEVLNLLEIGNEDISEKILWFLENLTMNPNHSFLLGESAILSLTEFFKFYNPKLLKLASKPLIHLLHKETCGDYLNNQQIFAQNEGISLITNLLKARYPVMDYDLVSPVTSILHVLSIYLPKIRIQVANQPGLLRSLISIFSMTNVSPEIKDTTMMILVNLSLTEEAENPIFESGAIMPLLDIIASISSSEILRYHAISCLANLTSNPRIRGVLRSRYLMDSLCEILKEIDGSTDEYSMMLGSITVLISNLCIDEVCRYRALQTDIHSMLCNLTNYPHLQVRESIQRTLENLREPIPDDILAEISSSVVEDMSDGFEDSPSLLCLNNSHFPSDSSFNSIHQLASSAANSNTHTINSRHSTPNLLSNNHSQANTSSPTIWKGIYRLSSFTSPSRVSSNNLLNGANDHYQQLQQQQQQQLQQQSYHSLKSSPSNNLLVSPHVISPVIESSTMINPVNLPPQDEPGLVFRRGKIVKEIMDTEQAYVHALSICIRVYFNPLVVAPTNPPIIPRSTIDTIFSNIDQIFRINCEFLKKLRVVLNCHNSNSLSTNPDVMEVAQAFLWFWKQKQVIDEYKHYINGFNKAMESVHENRAKLPRFKEFLDKCQFSEQCKSETIDSYLIRPIQRLPRYILLLTDLLAHTVDMLERESIEDALARTKQIVDQLNESKRKAENFQKILILQQKFTNISEHESKIHVSPNKSSGNGVVFTKQILKEGLLMQYLKSKPSQYRYLILFNDQLFITIQKKDKYHILQVIPLLELKIIYLTSNNSNDSNIPENSFQLLWSSPQDTFEREMLLYATQLEEKEFWIKEIRDAVNLVKKAHIENILKSAATTTTNNNKSKHLSTPPSSNIPPASIQVE